MGKVASQGQRCGWWGGAWVPTYSVEVELGCDNKTVFVQYVIIFLETYNDHKAEPPGPERSQAWSWT